MHNCLLEILGRGVTVDTAELLTGWLNEYGYTLGDGDEASYKAWLEAVVKDLLDRRFGAAEQRVRSHLATDPRSLAGHMALAAVSLHDDAIAQAQASLETICGRRPDHTLALYALGHCSERLGDEARAVACYQDCLKLRSFLHLPLLRLAAIHVKNLQYESAIEHYLGLRQIDPEAMSVHVAIGTLYLASGQYKQAIQAFQNAILMNPDALVCQDPQIDRLIQEDQLDKALEAVEHQLEVFPQKADLLTKHADILCLMGVHDQAIEDYHQALHECPTYLEAAVKLATHCSILESFDEAARYFSEALEINDQIIDAYVGLATSYNLAGGQWHVCGALCSASMLQPHASLLLVQAARMLLKSADPCLEPSDDPAVVQSLLQQAFDNRLHTDPCDPMAHYAAGLLAFHIQGPTDSIRHLKHAVELHPQYPRAATKLILSHYAHGDNTQAMERLNAQAVAPDPATLELYYKTALLYCSRPRFAASMLNLTHHLNDNMADIDPTAHIRIVLQSVGALDRAEAMFDWLRDTIRPCLTAQDQG